MPPGTDVKAGDRIEYDGNVYTINGEPKAWTSPTGRVSHIQLNIERWAG
jgi:predicted YcjX-like family ATPase